MEAGGQTVTVTSPAATAEQTAAIAAAVENFRLETAPAPAAAPDRPDPWIKAALVDGVSAKDGFGPGDPGDPA